MTEEKQVVEYSVVEADIAQMRSVYMDLKITDLEDTEQFKQIKEARLIVKGKRCAVENERKKLKADALAWGKKVDGRAKEIFALIEPIETHLQNEEQKVIDEQNRIKAEEEARQKAIIDDRIKQLLAVEVVMSFMDVAILTDEEFDNLLMGKTLEFEEKQKRIAEEKAKEDERKKLEEIRLAEERAKQAEIEAQQKAEAERLAKIQADLDAQAKAIQDEKDRIAREEAKKKSAEEAKIKAEQEAKAKAEREAKEAEERKLREKVEAQRQEALKPDKEKLKAFAEFLHHNIEYPNVNSVEARTILSTYKDAIMIAADQILKGIDEL